MSTDPTVIADLIRKAQLAKQLATTGGQAPDQTPTQEQLTGSVTPGQAPQSPQVQSQTQTPVSPRDQALQEYLRIEQTPAPSLRDYHPSVGRRILGAILGGVAGMHDPRSGAEVGSDIYYGPYNKQLTDYQRKLAQGKQAFEAKESAAEETAKLGEIGERGKAEVARAGEYEAGKKAQEFKYSPEGQKFELEKARIEHPGAKSGSSELYDLTLKNGEELKGAAKGPGGQFIDPTTNTPIGPDAIDKINKVGTSSGAKSPSIAQEWGVPEQALKLYAQKIGKTTDKLDYDDLSKVRSNWQQTPQQSLQRSAEATRAQDAPADASYKMNSAYIERDYNDLDKSLQKYSNLDTMIGQNNAQTDALIAPQLLSAVVGGMGSGLRMTNKEIERALGGRTKWESFIAEINKYNLDRQHYQIPPEQREAIRKLNDALEAKVDARLKANQEARDALVDAGDDKVAQRKVISNYRKKLTSIDEPGKKTEDKSKDPLGILGQ